LLASMTSDQLAEHLLDVANQLNRGAARLIDRDEKAQVAAIDLRAGRRAKASAAYASACVYFAAGMELMDDRDWSSQYALTFGLRLERAECEFLSGNSEKAEQLIAELSQHGVSKVDQASVYHLKASSIHSSRKMPKQSIAHSRACVCSASRCRRTRPRRKSRRNTTRFGGHSPDARSRA
jgi:predicted ATPase